MVDKDHKRASRYLLGKLDLPPLPAPQTRGAVESLGGLKLSMTIVNGAGEQVGMLGQLLQGLKKATQVA